MILVFGPIVFHSFQDVQGAESVPVDSEMESGENEDYSSYAESATEDSLHDVEGMAFLTDVSVFDISVWLVHR